MATMNGPRFKRSRSLGLNVCGHPKAMRRAKPGTSRADRKLSTYGTQLLEKQRLRAYYGVLEKQFRRTFEAAKKQPGLVGENLVKLLETRIDNLVYRSGLATSIRQARQMVVHGHIALNGNKTDIPSHRVNPGDTVSLTEKAKRISLFTANALSSFSQLPYLTKSEDGTSVVLTRMPSREEIPIEINDHLIVEFYSR